MTKVAVLFLSVLSFSNSGFAAESGPKARETKLEEIRCAFDIGSGETKVAAAQVKFSKKGSVDSVKKLDSKVVKLPIKKTVEGGVLPEETIKALVKQLLEFKKLCTDVGATHFSGVATSGFRAAAVNGKTALARVSQETGIELKVITGEEEGVLGLLGVEAHFADFQKKQKGAVVVWDIGGGSTQFASRKPKGFDVVSLDHGAETFNQEMKKKLKRENAASINPLTELQMRELVTTARTYASEVSPGLQALLKKKNTIVVGIGSIHDEAIAQPSGLKTESGYSFYTFEAVKSVRAQAIQCEDRCFSERYPANRYPQNLATNLALVSGLMEGLKIERVYPLAVNLTEGVLREPKVNP